MDEEEIKARAQALLESQPLAVLATVMDGQPHCDIVALVHTGDLRCVLFATARASRKYDSLVQHPEISMLVDSRANAPSDSREAEAVAIDGTARDLHEEKANAIACARRDAAFDKVAERQYTGFHILKGDGHI